MNRKKRGGTINIRICREEDIPRVLEIEKEAFSYPYSKETLLHFLGSPSFLVAEEEKEEEDGRDKEKNDDGEETAILGYIIGEVRHGKTLIVSIAVTEEHRLKGVGTALMKELEDILEKRPLMLTIRPDNEGAYKFYKKLGYHIVGLIEDYYENGQDAYLMQK